MPDEEFSELQSEMRRRFSSEPAKPFEPPKVEKPTLEAIEDPTAPKPW
jgi:hypothetical protein